MKLGIRNIKRVLQSWIGKIIGIVGLSIDLTDKRKIKKKLLKSERELKIRNKISNIFLINRDDILYNRLLEYLLDVFNCKIGYFGYINDDEDFIVPTVERNFLKRENINKKNLIFPKESWGDLWGDSLKEKKILVSNESYNPPNEVFLLNNIIFVPIIFNNEIIGQFSLANKIDGFKNEDIKLLETISKKIALILNFRLRSKKEEKERKKVENLLINSERKYHNFLKNIKMAYYEVDLEGNFRFFNETLHKITGFKNVEILGRQYSEFHTSDIANKLKKEFSEIYKTQKGKNEIEIELKKKNRKITYIESSAYPLYDENDKLIGFFGLIQDISERKKAELIQQNFQKELEEKVKKRTKKLNETLKKQKRFLDQIIKDSEFKSEFLANMSHELRTPLNAIIGFSKLLMEENYGCINKTQKGFLYDINTSSEDLLNMINEILDISKIESGQLNLNLKYFSLKNMVNQIESTLIVCLKKKEILFEKKGLDRINKIYADPIKFKQILINLLDNAIKYTIEGKIELKVEETLNYWVFKISDTGIGIARKEYDIIFKEFKRGNSPFINSKNGAGLGLPLTKRLVNLHRGNIWFSSNVGKGTSFFFTIPIKK